MRLKLIFLTVPFFLMLFLSSCHFSEYIEYRIILGEDGKRAEMITTYSNISSGEEREKDVKNDFERLLRDWQDDDYLLQRAEDGVVVKKRELFIEDEKLIGRETGIIKDITDIYTFWVSNGERIMIFDADDYELVESNGKILKTPKNTLIVWPDDAKELSWKMKFSDEVEDFERNRGLMVKWLREYLDKKSESDS
ncbi:MAG: hypothetical protein ACE5IR_28085 [bacterium]